MRTAIVGAGNQGLGVAALLLAEADVTELVLLDAISSRAERGLQRLSRQAKRSDLRLTSTAIDATDTDALLSALRGADVVLNATFPELNVPIMRACLGAGAHYVDLYAHVPAPDVDQGSTIDAQLALDDSFRARALVAVPSVGVNPGWVDATAIAQATEFEEIEHLAVREVEWMDSDELLCSGPPEILIDLYATGGPNEPDPAVELVRSVETYPFPAPIGVQELLRTPNGRLAEQIESTAGLAVPSVSEQFVVLSAGLSMKDILLTALFRQLRKNEAHVDLTALLAGAFTPTADMDFGEARRLGTVRDAAWASVVEIRGRHDSRRVRRRTTLLATLQATSERIPWAPPGVLATSALPSELIVRMGRGEVATPGVHRLHELPAVDPLLDAMVHHGVSVLSEEVLLD